MVGFGSFTGHLFKYLNRLPCNLESSFLDRVIYKTNDPLDENVKVDKEWSYDDSLKYIPVDWCFNAEALERWEWHGTRSRTTQRDYCLLSVFLDWIFLFF